MKKGYIALGIILYLIPFDAFAYSFKKARKSANDSLNEVASAVDKGFKDTTKDIKKGANNAFEALSDPIAAIKEAIRKKYPVKQTLADDKLVVRQGKGLCPQELNFIKNRQPRVNKALKDYFDIDTPLKIGLCFSGGGNRAMLVSLGFLLGAQDIGLFDASYYTASLSGSSWTIVPFSYLNSTQDMSLNGFKDQLVVRIDDVMKTVVPGTHPIPVFTKYQNTNMQNNFVKRFAYDQYLSSIDMYGAFIGDFTLVPAGDNRLDLTWSSIAHTIEKGNIPLPMGSAVADKPTGKDDFFWFEVGPFEVGSDQLEAFVPIQTFGSKFKKGKVVSNYAGHAPEYPMSFYEGVFGSAFVASMNEMNRLPLQEYKIDMFGKTVKFSIADAFTSLDDNEWISNKIVDNIRFFPACFHNYTLGLPRSPISSESKLKLYDGGLDFDFPLPLIMRPARGVDFILVCDAMIDLVSIKSAAQHFKKNNIKFPDVSNLTEATISKPVTILNDPRKFNYDPTMITIAYCPFIKNDGFSTTFDPIECREEGYCNMLNFNYTEEQTSQVIGLTRYNVNSIKDEIKEVLQALQRHKLSRSRFEGNNNQVVSRRLNFEKTVAKKIAATHKTIVNQIKDAQKPVNISIIHLGDQLVAAKVKNGNSIQTPIDGKNLYALYPNTTYYIIKKRRTMWRAVVDAIMSKQHKQSEFVGKTTWNAQSDIIS